MNISIIITCYNSSKTIGFVVKQILKYIKNDDEIVIVDDGSLDDTVKIINKINDKRINLICLERVGRTRALNFAIKKSKGKYLFINDADDIPSQIRFDESLKIFTQGYDAVFGQEKSFYKIENLKIKKINFDIDSINKNKKEILKLFSINTVFKTNSLTHSTLAIAREKFFEVGMYDEKLDICEDLDLYFKFVLNNLKVLISNRIYTARNIGSSYYSSYSKKKYLRNLLEIRRKYRILLKPPIYTYIYEIKILFQNFYYFLKDK